MMTSSQNTPPRRRFYIFLLCSISLFAFTASTLATLHFMRRVTITTVPDLSNKSVESARSVLRVKRLQMEITEYRFNQRIAANHILEQDPLPGQTVESGHQIKVVVSRGARTLTIPNLTGLSLQDAASRLEAAGFNLGRITRYYTDEADKEVILDQYPQSGTNAAGGTNIHLLVSLGPRPLWCIMPNLKGWYIDDATNLLNFIGMELKEIKRQVDDEQPTGMVMNQTPPAGVRIKAGDPAGLVVSIQSATSNQTTRFVNIEYLVPPTQMEVRVKFIVQDNSGLREIYNAMEKPNSKISIRRTINGEQAQLYIYINGKLQEERMI